VRCETAYTACSAKQFKRKSVYIFS